MPPRPPDPRLIVRGQGPEREDLLALASELGVREEVDLPGFVDNPLLRRRRLDLSQPLVARRYVDYYERQLGQLADRSGAQATRAVQ